MLTKKILSLQHPLIKHWVQLRLERPYREEKKRVLLMGEKTIRDLCKNIFIHTLITVDLNTDIPAEERILVSESMLKKITGLEMPDGFAAETTLPESQNLSEKKYLLILDRIADPGNLGTLLRTAAALGWEGVIFTPGTVDPFNDKALRASKGAPFLLPYSRLGIEKITSLLREKKFASYLADIKGKPFAQVSYTPPLALILSSEAKGPSCWREKHLTRITIPMEPHIESLNVASSGAILLYAMRHK
jgi:TrmH family RNA methyltransferase